jgi:hypothetical protein
MAPRAVLTSQEPTNDQRHQFLVSQLQKHSPLVGLTRLHLGNQVLVEQTAGLLVQGAVDGDDIALRKHLLQIVDAAAANLLLLLGTEGLVVEVQQLFAVEGLQASQDALADAADSDGADNLVLEVVLILGSGGDLPLARLDVLVGRDEVAHQDEDGHDDMLGYGHDVGARHLGHGDAAVCLVCSIEIDVVRANASGDGELEFLGLGQTLGAQVSGVEAALQSAPDNIASLRSVRRS